MIILSNGHYIDFCCASGALGFDGDDSGHGLMKLWKKPFRWLGLLRPKEFTVIAKTVTLKPRKGNLSLLTPWRCVRRIKGGWVNSVGLTNPGYFQWFVQNYNHVTNRGYKMVASISPDTAKEAVSMCSLFNHWYELVGVQINLSCPNVQHTKELNNQLDIVESALITSHHPILLKLGYHDQYVQFLKEVEKRKLNVEAVELINTVPWDMIYPDTPSPLAKYNLKGGVSGRPIAFLACKALHDVKKAGIRIPVISGGGIYSYDDVVIRHGLGARAFAIGTLFTNRPWLPNVIANKYRREYGIYSEPNKGVAS